MPVPEALLDMIFVEKGFHEWVSDQIRLFNVLMVSTLTRQNITENSSETPGVALVMYLGILSHFVSMERRLIGVRVQ